MRKLKTLFDKEKFSVFARNLRQYVDGDADTPFEYMVLFLIVVNTISLGMETSRSLVSHFGTALVITDQVCLLVFLVEIGIKFIAFNREFFAEKRIDEKTGEHYLHVNYWNIFDLTIIAISLIASLSYSPFLRTFSVFRSIRVINAIRSFRIVKTLKLINNVTRLRTLLKAIVGAIPNIAWTFSLLAILAYVYAIIGTHFFRDAFPLFFDGLGKSLLTLCQITTFDDWVSEIARPVIAVYPWSWLYFATYVFLTAFVMMNVIVGIIVDSINTERENKKIAKDISLEDISSQIQALHEEIAELKKQLGQNTSTTV